MDEKRYGKYGSHGPTFRTAMPHKVTYVCRIKGCGYSSRDNKVGTGGKHPNKFRNTSWHCPVHGDTLIDIGDVDRLPPKGKKRDKFITNKLKIYKPK